MPVPGGIGRTLAIVPLAGLPAGSLAGLAGGVGARATTVGEAAGGAALGRAVSVGLLASGGVLDSDVAAGEAAPPGAGTAVAGVPVGSFESSDGVHE
jgi:hypothetical protein